MVRIAFGFGEGSGGFRPQASGTHSPSSWIIPEGTPWRVPPGLEARGPAPR